MSTARTVPVTRDEDLESGEPFATLRVEAVRAGNPEPRLPEEFSG